MDILSQWAGSVGAKGLPPGIERAPERQIAKKYAALNDELGKLRLNTIGSTYVDGKGNLKVNQTPGLTALQARISEKEQALEKLISIAGQVGTILDEYGVGSIEELRAKSEEHHNTIQSGPVRCWDQFRLHRELPPGHGGYPHLLPSDLAKVESYKAFEDEERAKMEAAKAALEPINAALQKLSSLVAEANGL